MAEAGLGMQEQYRKEGAASGVLAALVSGQWGPSGGGGSFREPQPIHRGRLCTFSRSCDSHKL